MSQSSPESETVAWQARPPHSDWRLIAPEHVDDYRAKDWEVRPMPRGLAQTPAVPEGATHMRHPEYLTAWLYELTSTWPVWLVEKYTNSPPVPERMIGCYATAVDGEFWRWFEPEKFNALFVAVADTSTDRDGK